MKKKPTFLLFLLIVLFSSCYSGSLLTYKNMNLIQRGMSAEEVIAILGTPNYRSFNDKGEILEFRSSEYGPAKTVKIRFIDDEVVEMQSYLDQYYNEPRTGEKLIKEEDKEKKTEKETSSQVRVTKDGKHVVKIGSIVVTPEGKHEVVVSDFGGVIVTASGEHIHTY